MNLPDNIFREYDIRGIADSELTDETIYRIARSLGAILAAENKKSISIGRDHRKSSDRIFKSLASGLKESGMNVYDLGLVPTPLVYFSIHHFNLDAGICITGSHNPPDYNGLKTQFSDRPFFGPEIQNLKTRAVNEEFVSGEGSLQTVDIIQPYQEKVRELFKFKKSLKVVLDTGHGMAGVVAPELIQSLGHEVETLYENLDSNFPDHHPDPSVPANLEDLQKKVLETGADIGMAFDGDGDRVGVVDEKGHVIYGDKLLYLYAAFLLEANPGALILGDVKCSKYLYDGIEKLGGRALMCKTGHSIIKSKMKETGALLAGEMSGHMFFKERWYGFDDAVYAACRALEVLDCAEDSFSALLKDFPESSSTPELHVDCSDAIKFKVVEALKSNLSGGDFRIVDVDGVRVEFEDGWGLVRASNTQPVLVLRFEASCENRLLEIRSFIEGELNKVMQKETV